jgi:hypothetical protein
MENQLKRLIGLRLESCRFSRGSTTFEFDGTMDGVHHQYELSTSVDVGFSHPPKRDDEESLSSGVWPILETELKHVELLRDYYGFLLGFDGGRCIYITSEEDRELYLCKNCVTGEWWAS